MGNIDDIILKKPKEHYVYELINNTVKKQYPIQAATGLIAWWAAFIIDGATIVTVFIPLFFNVRELYIRNENININKTDVIKPVINDLIHDAVLDTMIPNISSNLIKTNKICWILGLTSAYIAKYNLNLSSDNIKKVADIIKEEFVLKGGALSFYKDLAKEKNKAEVLKQYLMPPEESKVVDFLNKKPSELGL